MKLDDAFGPGARGERPASTFAGWEARLELGVARDRDGKSRLRHALHEGPLRVQRPFYPEGQEGPCHLYVLHPPGGVVHGDSLELTLHVGREARTLLTTPGATKLYRAQGHLAYHSLPERARIAQTFHCQAGALTEWLPQETIVFSGADASIATRVELADEATFAGWEIVCLGRPASAERFLHGALRTSLEVVRDGRLQYVERGRYRGGEAMLQAPWGLGGAPVVALFIVASPRADSSWVDALREHVVSAPGTFAATLVSGLLLVRALCGSTREARALFEQAHAVLRPRYAGLSAVSPRIWST